MRIANAFPNTVLLALLTDEGGVRKHSGGFGWRAGQPNSPLTLSPLASHRLLTPPNLTLDA